MKKKVKKHRLACINIRVTEDEYKKIKEKAEKLFAGNVSYFIRKATLEYKE